MRDLVSFEVLGLPAPQGSKTKMPNGHVVEGSSTSGRVKHQAWRGAVAWAAHDVAPNDPHDGPLQLSITFRFPMPQSRPAAIRALGVGPHAVRPDKDKVLRATLDGLVDGGLIADDARVFAFEVTAFEVTGWTGAEITLRQFDPDNSGYTLAALCSAYPGGAA